MSSQRPLSIPRRQIIRGLLAAGAFGATSRLWVGCAPTPTPEASSGSPAPNVAASAAKEVVMGFIYVGPKDDYGWNQAHFEGREGVAKLPGVKTVEQASVPETNEVQEVMLNMINQDGATVVFPTSFGYYDPHILKVAPGSPDVQFFHAGGLYIEGKHPKNVGSYFAYIDEAQYVAGIVAAHMAKNGKLGFIAAKPIPQVVRNVNSYTLGARTVNPKATTQVIFTGDWSLPVKEAEAANSMADQGIEVITCHVDSPKVIMETAEKRGIYCTGYHTNQSKLAPKGYLTGAEWDWSKIYGEYARLIQEGKMTMDGGIPHLVRGGYKEGFVKVSDYSPAVTDAAKKDADAAKAALEAETLVIYKGPLKDNTGKVVIPEGKEFKQKDTELEKMDWLVEGVLGTTRS
ncbi:ABC transporter, substrate-binding protein (cluster 11, riboflavin/purine nucleoside/unknown) [uncultured Leptolyngbya sp.]|uniref:ABC transporter substrate-binding protein PnrA-like domain-containing protein n=1 Tax=uncultured Leptolyngbya sp. TaxID=332963 RepID=A0A6J4MMN2_9CYAN|nr:ABC transporter, substrate-binding protein (cluster 11, riboflavin/purine nucleoside/unknown) [uncultured Leptolyngbya sp.]